MELRVTLEESAEGEYRMVVRSLRHERDIITMPWVQGNGTAVKQLGELFNKGWNDVLFAMETGKAFTSAFIQAILARAF